MKSGLARQLVSRFPRAHSSALGILPPSPWRRKFSLSWPRTISGRFFFSHRIHRGSKDSMQYSTLYLSSTAQVAAARASWFPRSAFSSTTRGRPLCSNRGKTSSRRGICSSVPSRRYRFTSSAVRSSTRTSDPAVRSKLASWITARFPSFIKWTSSSTPKPRRMASL